MESKVCRIAVFYDGTYFHKVSNFYAYQHERQARLSVTGLHKFIVAEVARCESIDVRHCQIVDASYFRGRLTAQQAQEQDKLFSERVFEDVLMRANVTLYQQHVSTRPDGTLEEKRIDVWLALEAYEMATIKRYDVCVLLTGDGDFVPLARKLITLGSRVMLIGWDFEYEYDGKLRRTRVSTGLIDQVNYPVLMDKVIDARDRRDDSIVNGLFMPKIADNGSRAIVANDVGQYIAEGNESAGAPIRLFPDKGYGFIAPKEGGENIFFHFSELRDVLPDDLTPYSLLKYALVKDERGRLIARDVRLVR